MKQVLVIGASGRLGRHLVPQLLEHDCRVKATVNRTSLPAKWAGEVEQIQTDLSDQVVLQDALRNIDVVCHLAALMPPVPDDVLFENNIRATYLLLQAVAAQTKKPRFVFASTDATYCTGWSLSPYSSPIDENTPQRPVLFYGISKVVGEQMCVNYQEAHGIPTVRLRFPTIMEPHEFIDLFVGASYKDLLVPEETDKWDDESVVKVALEEDGRPFVEHVVDVRDATQGVLLAIEKDSAINQVFNLAAPAPFTYLEIGPIVATRLGVEAIQGRCKGLYSFELSIHKARAMLGYNPSHGILDSLEDAFAQPPAATQG